MKRAVAALVLLVALLAATWLAPDGPPAPERPPAPAVKPDLAESVPVGPDQVEPPPVVPAEGLPWPSPAMPGDEGAPVAADARLVRLLCAETKGPLGRLPAAVVSWDGRRRGVRIPPTQDGWVVLPRPDGVRLVEIGRPGYRRVELDLTKLEKRTEVYLTPEDPAAHATLVFPEGDKVQDVRVELRPLHPDGPELAEYAVLVRNFRFNENRTDEYVGLHDLPDGDWALEITAVVDGSIVSAKAEIPQHGKVVDLGDITLEFGAGIRARVVDADGTVVPQAIIRMCREEEDETKSRTWKADDEGWVTFRDFEPGMWHRVTADGLPGPLSKLVLTPKKRGEVTSVELEWPEHLVPCELELDLGESVDGWAVSLEGPVKPFFFDIAFGVPLSADLLPGEYTWTATLTREGQSRTMQANHVVPAAESHEATLRFE